jgi:hypothetical protein
MSKKCGHTIPCGCKDVPLTTGAPCGDGVNCTGNPCAENFCADCILWCGPALPNLGVTTGMPLSDIIQLIEISLVANAQACVDDTDVCKSLIWDFPVIATSTTVDLSWTYLDPTQNSTNVLIYETVAGGVGGKIVLDSTTTGVKLEGLLPDTEYKIFISLECSAPSGEKSEAPEAKFDLEDEGTCVSPEIIIKTLKP